MYVNEPVLRICETVTLIKKNIEMELLAVTPILKLNRSTGIFLDSTEFSPIFF